METRRLPKIELHLHLEGAMPPGLARALAAEKRIDISRAFDASGGYAFADFAGFLRVYEAAASVLRGPDDYARLTAVVAADLAEQGVIYAEMFIAPEFCGGGDPSAWREHLAAIREAAETAQAQGGPILRGIATAVRHAGRAASRVAAQAAAGTAEDFLVGFGLAGDETAGRPADFAWAFDCAREAGLGLTAHAGEWSGPQAIRDTLAALRPARLGHALSALREPALVDTLAADGIVLELCPGSNIALGAVACWADHPIAALRDAGVAVTVSTDDPPFFGTDMSREFTRLHDTFGWDEPDFRAITETAARAAFCDAATRARILKTLEETG
ncbi:adenosine deaminase [Maritimibacter sp. 55A14]|uniref:adenosine deaminase n=1 Tax=Maritimibacter sp. 55A14 TaxID=2174844 RepID=UPI000D6190BC|nr:adenosine deaminase [Maritimibacter sp. 55A14]PWE28876.1 adenosine deaminase [Maritimibacter sp. 55A14]